MSTTFEAFLMSVSSTSDDAFRRANDAVREWYHDRRDAGRRNGENSNHGAPCGGG